MAPALACHDAARAAAVLAFPGLRRDGALMQAVKSHRLPAGLENALLRETALCGGGRTCLERALAARLRLQPLDLHKAHGILLFGPNGAGKSAVAAKIARAAQALGRTVDIITAAKGMAAKGEDNQTLIIADCAGFNPRNAKACAAFGALGGAPAQESRTQPIAVLSALSDAQDISEIAASLALRRVIVTGLDMTRRAGALAAAVLQGAALAHVTRGPGSDAALESLSPAALATWLAAPTALH